MTGALASLEDLLQNVNPPKADTDYIEYFCGENSEDDENIAHRDILYALTASLTRSFASCCDKLVSNYGYSENQVDKLRRSISGYNKIKEMIKLASCDYIDLKPYEVDMRYILDTYIRADDSTVVSELGNMSLVELLLEKSTTTPIDALVNDLPGNDDARAEIIENNLQHEIVKKMSSNEVYYGKLSEMLQKIIEQRRIEAMSYEEYLRQVVELAQSILHPEDSGDYPESVKDSGAKRALYDFFDKDEDLAISIDDAVRSAIRPDWKRNYQKQQNIRSAIYENLQTHGYSEDIAVNEAHNVYDLVGRQAEYEE
jgi:type I restriction enzyme R subunit